MANRILVYLNSGEPRNPISHLKPYLEDLEQQSGGVVQFFEKPERYGTDDDDDPGELCIGWMLDFDLEPIPLGTPILPAVLRELRLRASQLCDLADELESQEGCAL